MYAVNTTYVWVFTIYTLLILKAKLNNDIIHSLDLTHCCLYPSPRLDASLIHIWPATLTLSSTNSLQTVSHFCYHFFATIHRSLFSITTPRNVLDSSILTLLSIILFRPLIRLRNSVYKFKPRSIVLCAILIVYTTSCPYHVTAP